MKLWKLDVNLRLHWWIQDILRRFLADVSNRLQLCTHTNMTLYKVVQKHAISVSQNSDAP